LPDAYLHRAYDPDLLGVAVTVITADGVAGRFGFTALPLGPGIQSLLSPAHSCWILVRRGFPQLEDWGGERGSARRMSRFGPCRYQALVCRYEAIFAAGMPRTVTRH